MIPSDRSRRVVASTLWAAWADALGFISELTDEAGLRRRLRGRPLTEPVEWIRRVGGRFGVDMELPRGCYSDDTQLRIATARTISQRGFDVEAFAKVELPLWPAYALGGGKASKAAASHLSKTSTPWYVNSFKGWTNAGGNGVAMRIQPHVWAARRPSALGPHILDVIVNGATTHGHPRALVGAVLHAIALGVSLDTENIPTPKTWPDILRMTEESVKLMDDHTELSSMWRPNWEATTRGSFADAWRVTVGECAELFSSVAGPTERLRRAVIDSSREYETQAYEEIISALRLRDPAHRGSGTATVVAAIALAAAFPGAPQWAALASARSLGTDTDTIATMTAAIIGAAGRTPSPPHVLDEEYLTEQARRLSAIAQGEAIAPFPYPDLLHWVSPRSQLDAVGLVANTPALAGLTLLWPVAEAITADRNDASWRWWHSELGQSFLLKQRPELRDLPPAQMPAPFQVAMPETGPGEPSVSHPGPDQLSFQDIATVPGNPADEKRSRPSKPATDPNVSYSKGETGDSLSVDDAIRYVRSRQYSDDAIGYAVRRFAETGTIEQMVAFAVAVRSAIRG